MTQTMNNMHMHMLEMFEIFGQSLTERILEQRPQTTIEGEVQVFKLKYKNLYESQIIGKRSDDLDGILTELSAYSACGVFEFKRITAKQIIDIYTFEPEIIFYMHMIVEKMDYMLLETMIKLLS